MARKRFTAEKIILNLPESEVALARGKDRGSGVQTDRGDLAEDLPPVEEGTAPKRTRGTHSRITHHSEEDGIFTPLK